LKGQIYHFYTYKNDEQVIMFLDIPKK